MNRADLEADFEFLHDPVRQGVSPGLCQWCEATRTIRVQQHSVGDNLLWEIVACKTCFVRWSEHVQLTGTVMAGGVVALLHLRDVIRDLTIELRSAKSR